MVHLLGIEKPLLVDPYEENRLTGAFVLIDEGTNETVGAVRSTTKFRVAGSCSAP